MADDRTTDAERTTRNKGLQQEEKQLHEADGRPPHSTAEQTSPEPERLTTPQEDAEQSISQLENPPQAEGPRERNNDAV